MGKHPRSLVALPRMAGRRQVLTTYREYQEAAGGQWISVVWDRQKAFHVAVSEIMFAVPNVKRIGLNHVPDGYVIWVIGGPFDVETIEDIVRRQYVLVDQFPQYYIGLEISEGPFAL